MSMVARIAGERRAVDSIRRFRDHPRLASVRAPA